MLTKHAVNGGAGDAMAFRQLSKAVSAFAVPQDSSVIKIERLASDVPALEAGSAHPGPHPLDDQGRKRAYHNYLRYVNCSAVLSPPITRSSIRINERCGKEHETLGSEGRPYTQEDLDAYKKAKTQLDLGDWMRSREIASFFFKHGFALPTRMIRSFWTMLWITRT